MKTVPHIISTIVFSVGLGFSGIVTAYEAKKNTESKQDCERQFTFSWSLHKECGMKPRGGTSKGANITLDPAPHGGWLSLKETGITDFERDRRAILAMAGAYRTSFDFIETVGYTADFKPDNPYQSWGTEYVYVIADRGDFISLQHIMVMNFVSEEGEVSEPMVMKHWRQDWQYEKRVLLDYVGNGTWKQKKLRRSEAKGTWAQSVFQVDDSPRYESYGRWDHRTNFSTWVSANTWRPLPRREHSVRDDYQVLEGTNRHTILPTGWAHEQENYKLVVDSNGVPDKEVPYLAKELGVNRYEKIINHDFSAGDTYWQNTKSYWQDVRSAWQNLADTQGRFSLKKVADNQPLFVPLFLGAEKFAGEAYRSETSQKYISEVIAKYLKK